MASLAPSPVHLQGHLDPRLSRWLWLVKWVLAIPHAIVLAFLWLAFFVVSVAAFFAILFTGRYPRPLFEFNVGVLRWTWRVGYYCWAAFGTDRYPPFTLADVPDYPARLEIAYPEHLSRGLVLVKWWLLAIPQYVVVGLLSGAAWVGWRTENVRYSTGGTGLIGFLVLVAAIVLLFTGRYPRQLFDLVLGLNRWVVRVVAYAALMTDQYPPFRLDMGPDEPSGVLTVPSGPSPSGPATFGSSGPAAFAASGPAAFEPSAGAQYPASAPPASADSADLPPSGAAPVPSGPAAFASGAPGPSAPAGYPPSGAGGYAPSGTGPYPPSGAAGYSSPGFAPVPPSPSRSDGWTAGRVASAVIGALVVLVSLGVVAGGIATLWLSGNRQDGYVTSGNRTYTSLGYALTTDSVQLEHGGPGWARPESTLGNVRLRVTPQGNRPVFVGIAPTSDVQRYLGAVARTELRDLPSARGSLNLVGGAPAGVPARQTFWVTSTSGSGPQTVVWKPRSGSWTVVAMNADASAAVTVRANIGAQLPWLGWVGFGLLAGGVLLLAAGVALIVVPSVLAGRRSVAADART